MIESGTMARTVNLPRLTLANGTVELTKWLALILMTADHFNKYLYNGTIPGLTEIGRLAMPLFAFAFAYNLSRPGTLEKGVYQRVLKRLTLIGAIATVPYIALGGVKLGWWPLNILFTLLVSAAVLFIYERGGKWHLFLALIIFIVGGSIVEFMWPAIMITLAAWHYCKQPSYRSLAAWIAATCLLYLVNGNLWALTTLPLIFFLPYIRLDFPRWKNAFYFYYPAHLIVLWFMALDVK